MANKTANKSVTTIPQIIVTELLSSLLTADGKEINNPTPLVCHTGLNRPLSLDERVDRMLAIKLSQRNVEHGGESIEEATDFVVEDEFETEPIGNCEYSEMDEEFINIKTSNPGENSEPGKPETTNVEPSESAQQVQNVSPQTEPDKNNNPVQTNLEIEDGKLT